MIRAFAILSALSLLVAQPGQAAWGEEKGPERVGDALRILERVDAGRRLVLRAEKAWGVSGISGLQKFFRWGPVSRTDAVLTRHFDPGTGAERRERKVTVYIREGQSLEDLILDIAHELTHATAGPSWDPYDPALTAAAYIHAGIDGEGGEVEALFRECEVAFELSMTFGISAARCMRYRSADARKVLREKIQADFYRVGKWYPDLLDALGKTSKDFPLLTPESPQLFSSTGQTPYPYALLKEYGEITDVACENSRKRLARGARSGANRSPAFITKLAEGLAGKPEVPRGDEQLARAARFIEKRCR